MTTDEKLDRALEVLLTIMEYARRQENRASRNDERIDKILGLLVGHSERLDTIEAGQPRAH